MKSTFPGEETADGVKCMDAAVCAVSLWGQNNMVSYRLAVMWVSIWGGGGSCSCRRYWVARHCSW